MSSSVKQNSFLFFFCDVCGVFKVSFGVRVVFR